MSRSAQTKKKNPTSRSRRQSNWTDDNPKGSAVTMLAIGGAVIGTAIMTFVMMNRKAAAMEVCGALSQLGAGA